MVTDNSALWTFIERAIDKCGETEHKSEMFMSGFKRYEGCATSGMFDQQTESDIMSYVAASQRIGYTTGLFEGAKLMHLLLTSSVNDLNEIVLDLLDDKVTAPVHKDDKGRTDNE